MIKFWLSSSSITGGCLSCNFPRFYSCHFESLLISTSCSQNFRRAHRFHKSSGRLRAVYYFLSWWVLKCTRTYLKKATASRVKPCKKHAWESHLSHVEPSGKNCLLVNIFTWQLHNVKNFSGVSSMAVLLQEVVGFSFLPQGNIVIPDKIYWHECEWDQNGAC